MVSPSFFRNMPQNPIHFVFATVQRQNREFRLVWKEQLSKRNGAATSVLIMSTRNLNPMLEGKMNQEIPELWEWAEYY